MFSPSKSTLNPKNTTINPVCSKSQLLVFEDQINASKSLALTNWHVTNHHEGVGCFLKVRFGWSVQQCGWNAPTSRLHLLLLLLLTWACGGLMTEQ